MESKVLAIILILVLGEIKNGEACQKGGEVCGISNNFSRCCGGYTCESTNTDFLGGICMEDGRDFRGERTCKEEGKNCGGGQGLCCDELQCSNRVTGGTCENTKKASCPGGKCEPEKTCKAEGEECVKLSDYDFTGGCCEGFCSHGPDFSKQTCSVEFYTECQEGKRCGRLIDDCCDEEECTDLMDGICKKKASCQEIGSQCSSDSSCCPGSLCVGGLCRDENEPKCGGDGEDCGLFLQTDIRGTCCDGYFCTYHENGGLQRTCSKWVPVENQCQEKGAICGPLDGECCEGLKCANFPIGTCK